MLGHDEQLHGIKNSFVEYALAAKFFEQSFSLSLSVFVCASLYTRKVPGRPLRGFFVSKVPLFSQVPSSWISFYYHVFGWIFPSNPLSWMIVLIGVSRVFDYLSFSSSSSSFKSFISARERKEEEFQVKLERFANSVAVGRFWRFTRGGEEERRFFVSSCFGARETCPGWSRAITSGTSLHTTQAVIRKT